MSVEISNEHNINEDEDEAWLYGENISKHQKNDEMDEINEEKITNEVEMASNDFTENIHQEEMLKTPEPETINQENEEIVEKEAESEEIVEKEAENEIIDEKDNNALQDENEVNKNEDEDDYEDSDEDDDDDGVNIVISDIKNITTQATSGMQGGNRAKPVTGPATIIPTTVMQTAKPAVTAQTKGIELETPGLINGTPTHLFEIGDLKDEEKPWLQPGADITDYFNYGFTEETWIAYCLKQKRLRSENNILKSNIQIMQAGVIGTTVNGPNVNGSSLIAINTNSSINQVISGPGQPPTNQANFNPNIMPPPQQMTFSKPHQFHPRFPPPGQPGHQTFQQRMGDQFNMPPPHIPDFSAPPPGWNPSGGPGGQQGMMPRIPQMQPQRMPLSGQQQPFNAPFQYGPQHGMHERPPSGMPTHFYSQFNRGSGQMMSQGPHADAQHRPSRSPTPGRKSPLKSPGQQAQSDRFSKDGDKYKQKDYSNRDYDKDHRRSPSPSRRHRRDHDRRDYDRRDRDRDRDRDRERGKSRDKSRDRSRDRSRSRDRDDKYKRSRHRSDDDDYRSSSKSHKRSKKSSRKDRDSNDRESSNNLSQSQETSDVKQD